MQIKNIWDLYKKWEIYIELLRLKPVGSVLVWPKEGEELFYEEYKKNCTYAA